MNGLGIAVTCIMSLSGGDVISLHLPQFTHPNSSSSVLVLVLVEGRSAGVFSNMALWNEETRALDLRVGGGAGVVVVEHERSVTVRVRFVFYVLRCLFS